MGTLALPELLVILVGGLLTLLFWAAVLVAIWKVIAMERTVKAILVMLEEIRSRLPRP